MFLKFETKCANNVQKPCLLKSEYKIIAFHLNIGKR